jgi:hypothetical protein
MSGSPKASSHSGGGGGTLHVFHTCALRAIGTKEVRVYRRPLTTLAIAWRPRRCSESTHTSVVLMPVDSGWWRDGPAVKGSTHSDFVLQVRHRLFIHHLHTPPPMSEALAVRHAVVWATVRSQRVVPCTACERVPSAQAPPAPPRAHPAVDPGLAAPVRAADLSRQWAASSLVPPDRGCFHWGGGRSCRWVHAM